jgi:hypothetical protein
MIIIVLLQILISLYPSLLYSQQYFVDETLTRLPLRDDRAINGGLADLDDDGDLDIVIVCTEFSAYRTYSLKNEGPGVFLQDSLRNLFSANHSLTSLCLGDVERDGDYDLFFTDYYDRHRLLMNNGNGIFTDESEPRLPENLHSSSADGALIDVDDDFDLDLSIANFNLGPNRLWLNRGNGYFTITSDAQFPSGGENSNALAWGDADGDFDLDCVIAQNTGYPNRLMINDGTGWFADETDERMPEDLGQSNGVAFVDIDGDRDLDIVIANGWFPGDEKIFINNGLGYFTDESQERIPQDGGTSVYVSHGDVDNDGDFDILISNYSTSGVDNKMYVNDGTGFFTDETSSRFPGEEEETAVLMLGDLDHDGDLDCIVVNIGEYPSGQQNRLLINVSTSDTILPVIARTLIHEDTSDTTGPYLIAASIWDNVSIAIGELEVSLHYRIGELPFTEVEMLDCGGYIYRIGIPGAPSNSRVQYYVEASDRRGNISLDPPNAPDSLYSFMVTGTGIDKDAPGSELPKSFTLSQNYPNPFNPVTEIVYFIPEKEAVGVPVKLVIYDMRGRLIKKFEEGMKLPGKYSIVWDAKDSRGAQAGSGIYFYLLTSGEHELTRKMLLVR